MSDPKTTDPYLDKHGKVIPPEYFDNDIPPPPPGLPKRGENPVVDRLSDRIAEQLRQPKK